MTTFACSFSAENAILPGQVSFGAMTRASVSWTTAVPRLCAMTDQSERQLCQVRVLVICLIDRGGEFLLPVLLMHPDAVHEEDDLSEPRHGQVLGLMPKYAYPDATARPSHAWPRSVRGCSTLGCTITP